MQELGTILVDCPTETDTSIAVEFLERLGHPVEVCGGPAGGGPCPVLSGEDCEKLDQATGVVFELDLDLPAHRSILVAYQERLADDTPLRVVVKPGQEKAYAALLGNVQVWTHAPTIGDFDGFSAQVEAAQD